MSRFKEVLEECSLIYGDGTEHRIQPEPSKKIIAPAADRNKDPILSTLRSHIQNTTNEMFLEISSGSGQHIAHFAPRFCNVTFYPSEYDPQLFDSIKEYAEGHSNIKKPLEIDVTTDCSTWGNGIFKPGAVDYIYNSNMMHISPYQCTIGLFQNAGKLLKNDGILFTYGPYAFDGKITPESNVNFNKSLKDRHPLWGLRDVRDLTKLAKLNGIRMYEMVDMPANNKLIVWKKC